MGGQELISLRGGHKIFVVPGERQQPQRGQQLGLPEKLFQRGQGAQRGQGQPLIGPCQTQQAKIPAVEEHGGHLL